MTFVTTLSSPSTSQGVVPASSARLRSQRPVGWLSASRDPQGGRVSAATPVSVRDAVASEPGPVRSFSSLKHAAHEGAGPAGTLPVSTHFGLREPFPSSEVTHPGAASPGALSVKPRELLRAEIGADIAASPLGSLCPAPFLWGHCHVLCNTQGLTTAAGDQSLRRQSLRPLAPKEGAPGGLRATVLQTGGCSRRLRTLVSGLGHEGQPVSFSVTPLFAGFVMCMRRLR